MGGPRRRRYGGSKGVDPSSSSKTQGVGSTADASNQKPPGEGQRQAGDRNTGARKPRRTTKRTRQSKRRNIRPRYQIVVRQIPPSYTKVGQLVSALCNVEPAIQEKYDHGNILLSSVSGFFAGKEASEYGIERSGCCFFHFKNKRDAIACCELINFVSIPKVPLDEPSKKQFEPSLSEEHAVPHEDGSGSRCDEETKMSKDEGDDLQTNQEIESPNDKGGEAQVNQEIKSFKDKGGEEQVSQETDWPKEDSNEEIGINDDAIPKVVVTCDTALLPTAKVPLRIIVRRPQMGTLSQDSFFTQFLQLEKDRANNMVKATDAYLESLEQEMNEKKEQPKTESTSSLVQFILDTKKQGKQSLDRKKNSRKKRGKGDSSSSKSKKSEKRKSGSKSIAMKNAAADQGSKSEQRQPAAQSTSHVKGWKSKPMTNVTLLQKTST